MEIKAISQAISPKSNLINFSGKQKQENTHKNSQTTPLVKAIPVAVLIAMSPLNSISATDNTIDPETNNIEMLDSDHIKKINQQKSENKVITQKEFKSIAGAQKLKIELMQYPTCKRTRFTYSSFGKNTVSYFNQIAKYNFSLISDDGSTKEFTFKNVHSYTAAVLNQKGNNKTPIIANNKAVLDYMEALNQKYPNSITIMEYNRKLAPTSGGTIQNNARGDILKKAKPQEYYGKMLGAQDVDGDNGRYTVRYYSTDGNNNNVEVVTVQKQGYPELKTGIVLEHNDVICADIDLRKSLKYGQVVLIDANNNSYNIVDNNLAENLKIIKYGLEQQNNAFNNAYTVLSLSQQYDMTTRGAFYAVD